MSSFRRFTSPRTHLVVLTALFGLLALSAPAAEAQSKPNARAASDRGTPTLVGAWSGTASVPLKDSTIVVPVLYTFTQNGSAIGGTAMVPGQGAGPISDVVRTGNALTFRVTAPGKEPKILEHEATVTGDVIEGLVKLDKQPIAKFRVTPKKGEATTR